VSISQVTELAQAFFPSPTDHVPCQRAPQLDFPQLTSLGHSLRLSLQVLFKTSSKYLPFNPEFDYIAIPSSTTCSGHFPVSSRSRRLPRDTSAQVSAARIVGTPPHALATGQIGSGCHLIQNSVVSQSQQQNSFRSFFSSATEHARSQSSAANSGPQILGTVVCAPAIGRNHSKHLPFNSELK